MTENELLAAMDLEVDLVTERYEKGEIDLDSASMALVEIQHMFQGEVDALRATKH